MVNSAKWDHFGWFSKKNTANRNERRIENLRNNYLDTPFDTSLCTNAAGSTSFYHTYSSDERKKESFDDVNDLLFAGKLKPLDSSRFIVDLNTLKYNMRCHNCNEQVLLEDIMGVLPSGICGHLVSRCRSCSGVVKIAFYKTHAGQHGKGPRKFDVNTKLATAMYHIGIGPEQLNNFLTTMNLPAVATKTIQRRCEEVGCTLKQLAEESTDRALQKEVEFTNTDLLESEKAVELITELFSQKEKENDEEIEEQ